MFIRLYKYSKYIRHYKNQRLHFPVTKLLHTLLKITSTWDKILNYLRQPQGKFGKKIKISKERRKTERGEREAASLNLNLKSPSKGDRNSARSWS